MLNKCISAALFLILLPAATTFSQEVKPDNVRALSLKDAINIAFMNNKPIQIQEEELEYAKANILDAQSKFLPTLKTGYNYTLNDYVFSFPNTPGARKDSGLFSGYKNDNAFNVTVTESIFNGGANIANYRQV